MQKNYLRCLFLLGSLFLFVLNVTVSQFSIALAQYNTTSPGTSSPPGYSSSPGTYSAPGSYTSPGTNSSPGVYTSPGSTSGTYGSSPSYSTPPTTSGGTPGTSGTTTSGPVYTPPTDMMITYFVLTDVNGNPKSHFSPGERAYVKVTIKNNGSADPVTGTGRIYSTVYRNQPTAFPSSYSISDPQGFYLDTGTIFGSYASYTYGSYPSDSRQAQFPDLKYFTTPTTSGTYTARFYVDNDNLVVNESNYSNNQATFTYTVGSPDLIVPSFSLRNQNGVTKGTADSPFFTTDLIYPYVTFKNQGDGDAYNPNPNNSTYSIIYKNRPDVPGQSDSTGNATWMQNGIFKAGYADSYYCIPTPGHKCTAYKGAQYWQMTTPGTYTARAFINYDHEAFEVNYNNNQATYQYTVVMPYKIVGRVYIDTNQNGMFDWGEPAFPNVTVALHDSKGKTLGTQISDSAGIYIFNPLKAGTYSVDVVTTNSVADYNTTGKTSYNVTIGPDSSGNNFGYFPKYAISGNVFVDTNDSNTKDGNETNYAALPKVDVGSKPANSIMAPRITNASNGTYTIIGLVSGTYTVQYYGLPAGYFMNNPRNGPPPTFSVNVGSSCSPGTPGPIGTCTNGNLSNLDFAIKPATPWIQAYGLDVRFDSGINNPIPPSPNAACGGTYMLLPSSSTTTGVGFSGNSSANFGRGQISTNGWQVGGASFGEIFNPPNVNTIDTAYGYMRTNLLQSNITPINLASVCTLNSCTLPANLTNGVYTASGDVSLNAYTFPANKDFVFLINGNLTINGTIHVPTTSTATFSTAGNITISSSLGSAPACPAPATGSGDVEGMFSADKNFILQGNHDCSTNTADKQLNMQGAIVVNAGQNGGTFQNNRDLCTNNLSYPTFTIKERPDFILNAPDFIKTQSLLWQEVAP